MYKRQVLVQVLPKAAREPALVALLEDRCREITGFSQRLQVCEGDLRALLRDVFPDLDPEVLADEQAEQPVEFFCPCTRERSEGALALLGAEELADMIEKDNGAELTCHYCGEVYRFSAEELAALIEALPQSA